MRTDRYHHPGVLYHCITRFVDREWFFDESDERERYLALLGAALDRSDWRCLAYALMSRHIHLAIIAGTQPMQSWLGPTHGPFTRWMNERHGRVGPIIADRPGDFQILRENEASVIAYIHHEPARAGVAAVATETSWTSHRAYVGLDPAPTWLRIGEGLARAGLPDPDVFEDWIDRTPGTALDITLEHRRLALRRRGERPDPRRVIEVVSELGDIAIPVICSRRNISTACDARLVIVHCGHKLGFTSNELAVALGISAQAVDALRRRPIDEHIRIVFDLALERLAIEAAEEQRWTATVSRSNGVPNQVV